MIKPRFHGGRGALHRKKIRLDVTLKPPIVSEHLGEQPRVFASLTTVQIVVGTHERGHPPVLHGHLEGQEVQLTKHPFIHGLGKVEAVCFLLVSGKVLGHGDDALALNSANLRHGLGSRQERILSEVLKIPTEHGNASQINPRRLKHVQGQGLGLGGDHLAETIRGLGIEGGGNGHSGWQGRRLGGGRMGIGNDARHGRRQERGVDAVVLSNTHRSVGNTQGRQAERLDAPHVPPS